MCNTYQERLFLVKRQLALEHRLGRFAVPEPLLEGLHERHRLLHLAHLADPGIELLVRDPLRVGLRVPDLLQQLNVLCLPRREGLGHEDGELLGLLGVEVALPALGHLLELRGLGRVDVGGRLPDVFARGRQSRVRGRHLGPCGELDRLRLAEDLAPDIFGPVGSDRGENQGLDRLSAKLMKVTEGLEERTWSLMYLKTRSLWRGMPAALQASLFRCQHCTAKDTRQY